MWTNAIHLTGVVRYRFVSILLEILNVSARGVTLIPLTHRNVLVSNVLNVIELSPVVGYNYRLLKLMFRH